MANSLPLLLPAAGLVYAGYRWWLRLNSSDDHAAAYSWALVHGFEACEPPAIGSTPTLELPGGAAHECWQVPIGDGSGTLYRWTWQVDDDHRGIGTGLELPGSTDIAQATVVQATLAAGFPHFRVVPRDGRIAPAHGGDERELQLESVEFAQRFRLLAGRGGDHETLLRLFDPDTIVWFIEQGETAPVVEYQLGTLATVSRYLCTTDIEFDALLAQAQHIAQRILAEGLLHQPDQASLPA